MSGGEEQAAGAARGGWAVVTGAGSGIGLEIARQMTSTGPVLAVDVDQAALDELHASHGELGIRCARADVADPVQMAAAVGALPAEARVRCLVNCAGVFDHHPLERMPLEAWERVLRVNLTGAFVASQATFPRLVRGAVVINIGSINGHRALAAHANYAASKAGLSMLTQCMAVEWARFGIRAIAVSPGIVDTPMNRRVEEDGAVDGAAVRARIPLGRYATAAEVAAVVCFLASAEAAYVSGAELLVDGGWTASGAM